MTAFSGWEMPVQYSSISREHEAVRTAAGMFDISHMGKFGLAGQVLTQIQRLVPSDLSRLKPGQAQYTVLLNSQGGIIDDLIFYFQGVDAAGQERWLTIVNASTSLKDKTWMLEHLDLATLEFEDYSATRILLAVQGPQAVQHLQSIVEADLSQVSPFGHLEAPVLGQPGFLARTGYTGEDGFEVMVAPTIGVELWRSLLLAGVVPCGLGARDTLRLEAAMALYGQDIDDTTTPLEAGLGLAGASEQRRLHRSLCTGAAKARWPNPPLSRAACKCRGATSLATAIRCWLRVRSLAKSPAARSAPPWDNRSPWPMCPPPFPSSVKRWK